MKQLTFGGLLASPVKIIKPIAILIVALICGYLFGNYFPILKFENLEHDWYMARNPGAPESEDELNHLMGLDKRTPSNTRVEQSIIVTSPKDGDEFCFGDQIPISFLTGPGAASAEFVVENPGMYYDIGQLTYLPDGPGPTTEHTYPWYGTWPGPGSSDTYDHPHAPYLVPESHLYDVSVRVEYKNGDSGIGKSVGKFSFIDCHTDFTPTKQI